VRERHESGVSYPGTRGRLRITALSNSGDGGGQRIGGPVHHLELTAGRDIAMQDNDIRGFLDGSFYVAWNQSGQAHVRVGREGYGGPISSSPLGQPPGYGEHELFRLLQCWEPPDLPTDVAIEQATLRMTVEAHCDRPLQVFLYRVLRDWEPGVGGEDRNNISVPRRGEVWWCYAKHEENAWSLPGAGHDGSGPGADVESMPLADCVYRPGATHMAWSSRRLAGYLESCSRNREPVRLLLKVSDTEEDVPGSQLAFFSADHGGDLDEGRRPAMELFFTLPGSRLERSVEVQLEHGRETRIPLRDLEPGSYWIDADIDPGYERPAVEVSGAVWTSRPNPCGGGIEVAADAEAEVTLRAAGHVIALGSDFEDGVRDTWITTGPPEDQVVEWLFRTPNGNEHRVVADYAGDYTWRVRFHPDELGPWTYRWRHTLAGPEEGPESRFDVLSDDPGVLREQLGLLAARLADRRSSLTSVEAEKDRIRFKRLQRALVSALGPDGLRSDDGKQALDEIRSVRSLLWGRAVPEQIPLRSMPLRHTVNGRPIADPIPYHPPPEHPASKVMRQARRLARRLRNGVGRRLASIGRTTSEHAHGEDER
jgi:hypothetical protein